MFQLVIGISPFKHGSQNQRSKTTFCFEDFSQKSLNASMVVTPVIVFLQQFFEVTRMFSMLSTTPSAHSCTLFIILLDVHCMKSVQIRDFFLVRIWSLFTQSFWNRT